MYKLEDRDKTFKSV